MYGSKLENNCLYIVENEKEKWIRFLSTQDLKNYKVMTTQELKKKLYFDYTKQTIFYIMKQYHLKYENALEYLENMYQLTDLDSKKVKQCLSMKQELEKLDLLQEDPMFLYSLKRYQVVFIGHHFSVEKLAMMKKIEQVTSVVTVENKKKNMNAIPYFIFSTVEQELAWIAEDILNKTVDYSHVKLINVQPNEYPIIKRIFSAFQIPIQLQNNDSIFSTEMVQFFLRQDLSDLRKALQIVKQHFQREEQIELYNQLVSICNDNQIEQDTSIRTEGLIYDLKQCKRLEKKYKNAVCCCTLTDTFSNDDFVYYINCNQKSLPKTKLDDDFFSDCVKKDLGRETSDVYNERSCSKAKQNLESIEHLILLYAKKNSFESFYESPILPLLSLEKKEIEFLASSFSHKYNHVTLAQNYDQYEMYGSKSPVLSLLANTYPDLPYKKYRSQFSGIHANLNPTLSYTSVDSFFRCQFRYYVSAILHLTPYQETFFTWMGSYYHAMLSQCSKSTFDLEKETKHYFNNFSYPFSKKEQFFFEKLKKQLEETILVIKEQEKKIGLKQALYETKVQIALEDTIFTGIIDKILYEKKEDEVAFALVDYKTGTPSGNLNDVIYGIDMQLPVYLFLAQHYFQEKNQSCIGFYLQKIIPNLCILDANKGEEQLKKEQYKWIGYSINQESLLEQLDPYYQNSTLIKSMKVSSKGFYSYAKILSKHQMEQLTLLVQHKLKEASYKIKKADFKINPKKIGFRSVGCEYCPFLDLCFKKSDYDVYLKEYKNIEFLKEEADAELDRETATSY